MLTGIVVTWNAKTVAIVIDEGLGRRRECLRRQREVWTALAVEQFNVPVS